MTYEELCQMLQHKHPDALETVQAIARETCSTYDVNGDGRVSLAEALEVLISSMSCSLSLAHSLKTVLN